MTSTHYRQVRGTVRGTKPGDSVKVWFEARGKRSPSFTYRAVSESKSRVLVVAAEDYTGASPVQTPGPHHLDYYLDALAANGQQADVYDIDAQGRVAPDALGVLSHYDAAIWYTGDDIVTRTAGRGAGNVDRLALDQMLEFRSFMNEGGKVMYTGNQAGEQYTGNLGTQALRPAGHDRLRAAPGRRRPAPLPADVRGSGDGDERRPAVLVRRLPRRPRRRPRRGGHRARRRRHRQPVHRPDLVDERSESADNQNATSSFIATSGILPKDEFPQFESWPSARWNKPGGPFDPHTGEQFVYSQIAGRVVQAAHPHGDGPGRRRLAGLLDVVRHRGGLGPRVRRGPHAGR